MRMTEDDAKRINNASRVGVVVCFGMMMFDHFVLERTLMADALFIAAALVLLFHALVRPST